MPRTRSRRPPRDYEVEGLVHEHQTTLARDTDLAERGVTHPILAGRHAAGEHPSHAAAVQGKARQAHAVLGHGELSATTKVSLVEAVDGGLVAMVIGQSSRKTRQGAGAPSQ